MYEIKTGLNTKPCGTKQWTEMCTEDSLLCMEGIKVLKEK